VASPVQVRISGVVFGWFKCEHPERDIKTIATQPVPACPQQDLQCAEQHGQCGVRGRFACTPAAAEHGQVTVS